jgi:mRNA interferase MazF
MVRATRGDIVLCSLDPVVGTEQAGTRPALILQTDKANSVSPHTIIAPFTTKIRNRCFLLMFLFQPEKEV